MKKLILPAILIGLMTLGCTEIQTVEENPAPVDKQTSGSEPGTDSEKPDDQPQGPEQSEDVPPLATIQHIKIDPSEVVALDEFNKASFDINRMIATRAEQVVNNYDGNYSFSPVSAVMCLDLIANSLDAPKNEDVAKVFGIGSVPTFNALVIKLLQYLPSPTNGVDMRLANSIWHSSVYTVSDSFRKEMAEYFGSPVYRRNFLSAATVNEVNDWASRNTEGMINHVIDDIDSRCDIMWFNALYFEGQWNDKFDPAQTREESFYGKGATTTTAMMKQENLMSYAENSSMKMVSVPFCGFHYFLDIVMPVNQTGTDISEAISHEAHQSLLKDSENAMVTLTMPRFKTTSGVSLSNILTDLGFPLIDMTFNTMGITGKFPTDAITVGQTCVFEVNEEGARAAAVTGGLDTTAGPDAAQPKKVEMKVDHPFVYIIREHTTGSIVMMGHISKL